MGWPLPICFKNFKNFTVPYFKPTLALHSTPTLHRLREHFAPLPGDTIPLRGQMWWEGKLQFLTHVAQPYPPALGIHYGALMAEAVRLRAVAIESGVRVPMAVAELAGVPSLSLQQAAWLSPWEGGSEAVACSGSSPL